jgi:hypothetical protein
LFVSVFNVLIILPCSLFTPSFNYFVLQRLAAGEWFTARVSGCGLFHIAYASAPEILKIELRSIYSQLCQDDMPMVRRSAAMNLGKYAATVESAYLKTDIMSMFEDLTQDGKSNIYLVFDKPHYTILELTSLHGFR